MRPHSCAAPIGIFDSGLGGLSVLRHVRAQLPDEDLLYFADTAFAPYGGRDETDLIARTEAATAFLIAQGAKALVIACNTATAAAIGVVRARYPHLPVIGVEPGLKPAAALSKRRLVGVLATERTVVSTRFMQLRDQIAASSGVTFLVRGCAGLADQVEKGELQSPATVRLVRNYVAPLLEQGADTLVLGCTHYPFLLPLIRQTCDAPERQPVTIVDTGDAVARQLARVLAQEGLLSQSGSSTLTGYTSGTASALATGLVRLLGIEAPVHAVSPA